MKANLSTAIAHALVDLKITTITNVPGYGGSETLNAYNQLAQKYIPLSFNEEVAYTIAHGSSIAGARAATIMKAQGLAKAANSIVDSLYTDITAGFVVFVFDDKSGKHSDNIMEPLPFLQGLALPVITAKTENIYQDVLFAYAESERRKSPVALVIDSDFCEQIVEFEKTEQPDPNFIYQKDITKTVVHPLLADYQYKRYTAKKLDGDVTSIPKPNLPLIPDDAADAIKPSIDKYKSFFNVFKDIPKDFVSGDTSASSYFAFPPYNSIDALTYIGGSLPLAIGAHLAGNKNVWALSGDFGFLAAGHMALLEIIEREIPIKMVIFYNKKAAATGGQTIHKKIMYRILAGYDNYISHISDPANVFEIEEVLNKVNEKQEFSIVLVDY